MMKELEQLTQKLELEELTTQEKLRVTKRIIQLTEEDNNQTRHSIYNSLLMLVDNQIELENLLKETFQDFESSLNRSHNEIMKFMKELRLENEKFANDIKKNFKKQEDLINPLLENYNKNQITAKSIKQYMAIMTNLAGFITASIIVYGAMRYILQL